MLTINKAQCSLTGNTLATEASTIQLAPGEWPDFIAVVNDAGTGFLFGPGKRPDVVEGEVMGMRYFCQTADAQLLVIND